MENNNDVRTIVFKEHLKQIIVTNEMSLENIESRLGLISSQCIYNMINSFGVTNLSWDPVRGRVEILEKALNEAALSTIDELKHKAATMGGDAIIGVKIDHTYNTLVDDYILSVFATGNVVNLKDSKINCYECGKSILKLETSCPFCGAPQN